MATTNLPRQRILVADDEPLICDALRLLLQFDGHEVLSVGSGPEALVLLEHHKFDLVIVDYAMPGMKGDELAAAIKSRAPDQPVIMISAYAETLESSRKPIAGVDALISKPFQVEDLRGVITRIAVSRLASADESRHSKASNADDHSGNGARDLLPSMV